ncbi:MAG TPA: hypothetical protein VNN79_08155, partial [Actinomycetota bacterium]|nr:hypothetical protein [Actinomycetota bacterium]
MAAVPVVLLAIWAYFGGGIDSHLFLVMVPWLCLISAAELMPVLYLPHVTLTLSMPLLLAAGMTLGPAPAGILGYLGAWDVRFFRGQVPFEREVFNRGQIALSSIAGATTFHALGGSLDDWPTVVIPCFLAILADVSVNMTLVAVGIFLGPKTPFGQVVKGVVLDYPMLFLATY